jgi:hypothetical protein
VIVQNPPELAVVLLVEIAVFKLVEEEVHLLLDRLVVGVGSHPPPPLESRPVEEGHHDQEQGSEQTEIHLLLLPSRDTVEERCHRQRDEGADDEKEVEPGYFVPIYVYPEIEEADQQHNSHGQLSQGPDDQRAPAVDPIGSDNTDDQRRDQDGSPNQRIVD